MIFPDVVERNGILKQLKEVVTTSGNNLVLDFTQSAKSGDKTEQLFTLTTENKTGEPYVGSFRYKITQMVGASTQFINQVKELAMNSY